MMNFDDDDYYEKRLTKTKKTFHKKMKGFLSIKLRDYSIYDYLKSTSSTSKISVAPGGITFPAPLSPYARSEGR